VEADPGGELAGDRVEDRDPVSLLALHVIFQTLLLRREDRPGEGPPRGVERRDAPEDVGQAAPGKAGRDDREQGTRQQATDPTRGQRAPVPRGSGHGKSPPWNMRERAVGPPTPPASAPGPSLTAQATGRGGISTSLLA